jgi:hypothetical protein
MGRRQLATIATNCSRCGVAPGTPNPALKKLKEDRKIERAAVAAAKRVAVAADRLARAPQLQAVAAKRAAAAAKRKAASEEYRQRRPRAREVALRL